MSKNKFVAIAKKETVLSEVMEDRTKLSVDEIIEKYPNGVTIIEFDIVTIEDPKKGSSTFPVFAIKEDPETCFFGGAILSKIASEWANAYGGDIETASAELTKCGGVKIKMYAKKTKAGNNLTAVDIIG